MILNKELRVKIGGGGGASCFGNSAMVAISWILASLPMLSRNNGELSTALEASQKFCDVRDRFKAIMNLPPFSTVKDIPGNGGVGKGQRLSLLYFPSDLQQS